MRRFLGNLPRRAFLVLMMLGSALITASSLAYFDFGQLPPFVVEKLPIRFEAFWLVALRVHVAAAAIAFPLCLVLATRWLQRRVMWHRWLGRLAGVTVLFALVPSGSILAFDAKGGGPVTAGFLLSGAIVGVSIVRGVLAARRHDLVAHRRAMRHVIGQMSVAVVSRALIVAADARGIDPDLAYVVALWGPVLASVVVVELLSFRLPRPLRQLLERTRREVSSVFARPDRAVGPRSAVRPVARLGR